MGQATEASQTTFVKTTTMIIVLIFSTKRQNQGGRGGATGCKNPRRVMTPNVPGVSHSCQHAVPGAADETGVMVREGADSVAPLSECVTATARSPIFERRAGGLASTVGEEAGGLCAGKGASAVEGGADKLISSQLDDDLAGDLPDAVEVEHANKGTPAGMDDDGFPLPLFFGGMPIAHWRDTPSRREWEAYQLSLPRADRFRDYGISPVLTPSEPSDPEEDSK